MIHIFQEEAEFQPDALYQQGYCSFSLNAGIAQSLLRVAQRTPFLTEAEAGFTAKKQYQNRLYGQWSAKDHVFVEKIAQQMMEPLKSYLSIYKWNGQISLTLFKGQKDYFMEWHDDVGENNLMNIFCYFTPHTWTPEHGGQIEFSKVSRDSGGMVKQRHPTGSFSPQNGLVLMVENRSTLFQHQVCKVMEDRERYLLVIHVGGDYSDLANLHKI